MQPTPLTHFAFLAVFAASASSQAQTPSNPSSSPSQWVMCANEAQTCYLPGIGREVAYGNAASGYLRIVAKSGSSTFCTPATFGNLGPISWDKSCHYRTILTPEPQTSTPSSSPGEWQMCANEAQTCYLPSANREVAYGNSTAGYLKVRIKDENSTDCVPATFGDLGSIAWDKRCYYRTDATTSNQSQMPSDFDSAANLAALRSQPNASKPPNAQTAATTAMCTGSTSYPAQWTWGQPVSRAAEPATSGLPRIEQYRNGALIATYSKLGGACWSQPNTTGTPETACGAFSYTPYRQWMSGDTYLVYPAVYEGLDQQPWIGPMHKDDTEYASGNKPVPKGITIRGVTVNGVRPVLKLPASGASNNTLGQALVYIDKSEDITIENIELDGGQGGLVGKAAIYVSGAKNLTLRDLRIRNFKNSAANGIFGTELNSGTLKLERVELHNNGGGGGPEHNIYINASAIDPNFTVWMIHSFSYDAYYGHAYKSRAQVNILEGNYFMGRASAGQGEAYLVDLPDGGRALLRNNILTKNASGANSNGVFFAYGEEHANTDGRASSIVADHNTFVAFSHYYDGVHPLYPTMFFSPPVRPDQAFPVQKFAMQNNVFVGFCNDPVAPYFGTNAWRADFTDLNPDFSTVTKVPVPGSSIVGTRNYQHVVRPANRGSTAIGARD